MLLRFALAFAAFCVCWALLAFGIPVLIAAAYSGRWAYAALGAGMLCGATAFGALTVYILER